MYKLTSSDTEDIKMLLNVCSSIYNNYQKLYALECDSKKDSREFTEELLDLKSGIDMENNLKQRLFTTPEKIDAIIKHLANSSNQDVECLDIDFDDQNKAITTRIINELSLANIKTISLKIKDIENSEAMDWYIKNFIECLEYYISLDVANLTLAILPSYNSLKLKSHFVKVKYGYSFIFSSLEKDLVENKFETSKNPYMMNHMIKNMFSAIKNVSLLRSDILDITVESAILKLSEIDEFSLINPDTMTKAILALVHIRSCLVLANHNSRENLIEKINSVLLLFEKSSERKMITKMLKESIQNCEQDKQIPIFTFISSNFR